MQKRCLFCKGWWPFLLLPLIPLLLAVLFDWRDIESDVAVNAQSDLKNLELSTLTTDTHNRGRELKLTGSAASQEVVDNAIQVAKNAKGVRTVTWQGEIINDSPIAAETLSQELQPQELQAGAVKLQRTAEGLMLSGVMGTNTLNETMSLKLASLFGEGSISNTISTNNNTTSISNLADIAALLVDLPEGSGIDINGDSLTLLGTVPSLGKKKLIGDKAKQLFDGEVDNQLAVQLQVIDSAQMVSINDCQRLFNELTSSNSVNFQTGSAIILTDSYSLLDQFTQLTRRCPEATFEVSGHTDSTGNTEMNNQLSQKRAEAVVAHIVNSGVNTARFTAKGYGPSKPIADNQTREGRTLNRRVEFTVTNK